MRSNIPNREGRRRSSIWQSRSQSNCTTYFCTGPKHSKAKPLKGFTGAGVLEMIDDLQGNTYRTVYTVKFGENIYVLHAFQKKSKSGIKIPKQEIDLIRNRLQTAKEHYKSLEMRKK